MPTTNEVTPEAVPARGFDPIAFWIEHKSKVLLYGGLLVAALAGCGFYEISAERAQAEARRVFAEAKSADDFRKVVQQFPKTVVAGDARLILAGQLREEKKYDEALAILRAFVADSQQHPLISSAWLSLGETLEASGKADEALDIYQQTATKFPDSYAAPMSMTSRAKLLQSQGKIEEAKRTYESVMSQYPESIFSQEAKRDLQFLKKK
jgi:TolA-binding protein